MSIGTKLQRCAVCILGVLLGMTLLVACGDDDDVATEREEIPAVTPGSNDEIPQGIEAATVSISDGAIGVDELMLQQGEPTELRIVNEDETAYTFEIQDLVASTSIPASTTTDVGFSTPSAGTFTGRLLDADGTVLDEFRVVVQAPGGVDAYGQHHASTAPGLGRPVHQNAP